MYVWRMKMATMCMCDNNGSSNVYGNGGMRALAATWNFEGTCQAFTATAHIGT